jgi:prepilin-type N-terminal cleavage/methylation domain-containing protein
MKTEQKGFTLIELLVVVAIISLLSSLALIGYLEARQKSRDAERLSDMTQMVNAMELYFSYNKGYPAANTGVPTGTDVSQYIKTIPSAPMPPDGDCPNLSNPAVAGVSANTYYYYPTGTSYVLNGKTLYPDYHYYFCLGRKTGNFDPGIRYITPRGIK